MDCGCRRIEIVSEVEVAEAWPTPKIVYSPKYNIGVFGLERLHPFDGRKYGRAWGLLQKRFGNKLRELLVRPRRAIRRSELLDVHTPEYLKKLRGAKFVAGVVEIPSLRYVPGWVADRVILRPMRWGTMGTVIAAREAMQHGLAINLSGGYHHANPEDGHGFSAYADVALAIHGLRASGKLGETDKVVYIDLDAHQGNGVCRTYFEDRRVFIYDQYNRHIFPLDVRAQRRIDCDASVEGGCSEADYLATLRRKLPAFLDSVTRGRGVRFGVYNAGTDIFENDQLGGMNVSAAGVLQRDRLVLDELIARRIPTLVVLSGGYSRQSYELVAGMVGHVVERWGS